MDAAVVVPDENMCMDQTTFLSPSSIVRAPRETQITEMNKGKPATSLHVLTLFTTDLVQQTYQTHKLMKKNNIEKKAINSRNSNSIRGNNATE